MNDDEKIEISLAYQAARKYLGLPSSNGYMKRLENATEPLTFKELEEMTKELLVEDKKHA